MADQAHAIVRKSRIGNELGLQVRAAAMVVRTVSGYASDVKLVCGDSTADARSVLDLLTLAAVKGTPVEIRAEGPDALAAADALEALIARNFAE